MTISILLTVGTIAADVGALAGYAFLPEEIKSYIYDKSTPFVLLHTVPFIMLIFDSLSFVFFILLPCIVTCCKYYKRKFKASDSLYTLLSPLSCIATHSYHLIFACIHNSYHATSVLLLYVMTLFVLVAIFQKIYYFVLHCFVKRPKSGDVESGSPQNDGTTQGSGTAETLQNGGTTQGDGTTGTAQNRETTGTGLCTCGKDDGQRCVLVLFLIVVIIALSTCIGLTGAVLIALPINDALDRASFELYAIYQVSVTVFAALVTFQIFFRHSNSIFTAVIKAADNLHSTDEKWNKKSKKEKEEYLGKIILKHIGFQFPGDHATAS